METNFESMTVDELIEYKLVRKHQIQELKEEQRAAHAVYTRKIIVEALAKKLEVDVSGLSVEEATLLAKLSNHLPKKPGDVVVSPGPAELTARSEN
jgi:hypothetical protein